MARREPERSGRKIWVTVALLVGLLLVSSAVALLLGADTSGANTAIIRISGPILTEGSTGIFDAPVASSAEIVELLEQARDDESITAVVLEINSPGGSAVASDEIASAVKGVRAEGKPVVAWIRDTGASGAYWVASSSDSIVANRMSITGSIGVIGSYLEFAEFLDEWNVTHQRLVAGDRKDIGEPFQKLSDDDREFIQQKLDRIHGFFIEAVAENRNMTIEDVRAVADGSFMLGVEAHEAGLIDILGGKAEAIAAVEELTGETATTTVFETEKGLVDRLLSTFQPAPPSRVEDLARGIALR